MSEFSESFDRAYAIHRAISMVMVETGADAALSLAEVIQRLGAEASMIKEPDLIKAIVNAANDAGVEVMFDKRQDFVAF